MVKQQMKKIVRVIGNSLGIIFNTEEQEVYLLKKGKVITIEIKDIK